MVVRGVLRHGINTVSQQISDKDCLEHAWIDGVLQLHPNNFPWFGFRSDSHTHPPQRRPKERHMKRDTRSTEP